MVAVHPGSVERVSRTTGGESRAEAGDDIVGECATPALGNVDGEAADTAVPPRQYMTGWQLYALTFA